MVKLSINVYTDKFLCAYILPQTSALQVGFPPALLQHYSSDKPNRDHSLVLSP